MNNYNNSMPLLFRAIGLFLLLLTSGKLFAADYDARLEWARRVELSTPVQGVVSEVRVQAGERVKAQTVLVQLDDRGFKAKVAEARARLKSFTAIRKEARREKERALELYDRTVLSNHELQTAKNSATQAEADYEAAQAALVQAELDLEYSSVRAPFDALVIRINAVKGQTVLNELKPVTLVTVADANSMVARSGLAGDKIRQLKVGQSAVVRIGNDRHTGKIKSIGLEPMQGENLYPVAVIFPVEQQHYRVGQAATIELP
jgi:multidrug efflux system membrane fusion protein